MIKSTSKIVHSSMPFWTPFIVFEGLISKVAHYSEFILSGRKRALFTMKCLITVVRSFFSVTSNLTSNYRWGISVDRNDFVQGSLLQYAGLLTWRIKVWRFVFRNKQSLKICGQPRLQLVLVASCKVRSFMQIRTMYGS